MGQQRIRKKRRRRIQKQNIPIVILSSITMILIFVWGGLYWKESSEKALIDPTVEKAQSQSLQELAALPPLDSKDVKITPVATGKVGSQAPKGAEKTGVTAQANGTAEPVQTQELVQSQEAVQTQERAKTNKPAQTIKSVQTKEPVTNSKGKSSTESDQPKQPESTGSIGTNASTSDPVDAVESKEHKYEQELTKLQAKCMKDVDVILKDAETSIPQLDKTNPVDVQTWQDHVTSEIATAESICERNYLDLIQLAEKDSVSSSVIEEWTQTYNALIVRLQDESRAKLQNLMGV